MIIPSVIASSQSELDQRIKKVSFAKVIHLDVMDEQFVPHVSLMFDLQVPKGHTYEAHLMMQNPKNWIEHNVSKVTSFIVHHESNIIIDDLVDYCRKKHKNLGVAINPSTPVEALYPYISKIGKVLIMTVNPGQYGAKFLPSALIKASILKRKYPHLVIQVDGGINDKTLTLAAKAGVSQFVVGSYLQTAVNPKKTWQNLENQL